jgi:hypothetical protein
MLSSNSRLRQRVAWERIAAQQAQLAEQGLLYEAAGLSPQWAEMLGPQMMNLLQDYSTGEPLPDVAQRLLEDLGITPEEVLGRIH